MFSEFEREIILICIRHSLCTFRNRILMPPAMGKIVLPPSCIFYPQKSNRERERTLFGWEFNKKQGPTFLMKISKYEVIQMMY